MEKIAIRVIREGGKIKIGAWKVDTWHYFVAPDGIETRDQVAALVAAQVAKQGKGQDDYTISFADNFEEGN